MRASMVSCHSDMIFSKVFVSVGLVVVEVSLIEGKPGLPAGDGPAGDAELLGKLLLRQFFFLTERFEECSDPDLIHADILLSLSV